MSDVCLGYQVDWIRRWLELAKMGMFRENIAILDSEGEEDPHRIRVTLLIGW